MNLMALMREEGVKANHLVAFSAICRLSRMQAADLWLQTGSQGNLHLGPPNFLLCSSHMGLPLCREPVFHKYLNATADRPGVHGLALVNSIRGWLLRQPSLGLHNGTLVTIAREIKEELLED